MELFYEAPAPRRSPNACSGTCGLHHIHRHDSIIKLLPPLSRSTAELKRCRTIFFSDQVFVSMTDLDSTEGVKQFALCKFDKPADGLRIWNRTLSESITTRLVQVSSSEHHLQLRCPSSGGDTEYAVYIELQRLQGEDIDWAVVTCTCPHANAVPLCKHGIAALLWRVPPEQNPGPQERHQPRNLSRLDNSTRYEGSQLTVPRSRLLPKSLRPQGTKGFDE